MLRNLCQEECTQPSLCGFISTSGVATPQSNYNSHFKHRTQMELVEIQ
jgi:hypothetical protein